MDKHYYQVSYLDGIFVDNVVDMNCSNLIVSVIDSWFELDDA